MTNPLAVDSPGTGNQGLSGTQHMGVIRLPLNTMECGLFNGGFGDTVSGQEL